MKWPICTIIWRGVYIAQNRFHNAELELITARAYLDKFPDNDVEVELLLSSDFWLPLGKNGMQMDDNIKKNSVKVKIQSQSKKQFKGPDKNPSNRNYDGTHE